MTRSTSANETHREDEEEKAEENISACPHCGLTDYSVTFGPRMCLVCACCEDDYHVSCLEEIYGLPVDESVLDSEEDWYCSMECSEVMANLARLTNAGRKPLREDSLYTFEVVKQEAKNKGVQAAVAAALKILKSTFDPLKMDDGTDMLENVVQSARSDGEDAFDFGNFRVVLLRKAGIAISAATLRVFGQNYAELPFIATRADYRRDGNCRRLVSLIEDLLREMKVKQLIVPSVKKLAVMWKERFGMKLLEKERLKDIEDRIIFPDPSSSVMLVKSLMAEEMSLESEDEEADNSEAEAPKAGTSEDRVMKLATVLAEESNLATGPSRESVPCTADPEKDEDSCSEMEEDFLDPPDVRPLWGNEVAAMLRYWKTSDDSWRHWDLDTCSFQSLLQGAEVQPAALQNDGSNQEVDSLYLSACNAVLDSAQRELESAAQRQIQMLALEFETRVAALKQENQSLREANVRLQSQLAAATETKRLHQRQQEETVPRAEMVAKELTIEHFTEASSIEKVPSAESGLDELCSLLPNLTVTESTDPGVGLAQICRCLEALGSGVNEVTDFFAQLQQRDPNQEFWPCLHTFLRSMGRGLGFTHELALKMQDQVMKEADAGRAEKCDEKLDGMHDCASRYEETEKQGPGEGEVASSPIRSRSVLQREE